jgi:phosphatidylserine decarboxylase
MSDVSKLQKLVRSFDPSTGFHQPWEDKIVDELYIHRYSDIGPLALEILEAFGKHDSHWHVGGTGPTTRKELMDWSGKSFMDLFTRTILPEKLEEMKKSNNGEDFVHSAECWVEGFGPVEEMYSDRLKKEAPECKADMENMGCKLEGYSYVNCRLLLSYYHWIHCPVNGVLKRIVPFPKEYNFFGDNSLWLVEYETKTNPVYLLIVGELNIQDFTFHCKEGQKMEPMDAIGHFGWGSQIMVFFKVPEGFELALERNVEHYFVGDKLIRKGLS